MDPTNNPVDPAATPAPVPYAPSDGLLPTSTSSFGVRGGGRHSHELIFSLKSSDHAPRSPPEGPSLPLLVGELLKSSLRFWVPRGASFRHLFRGLLTAHDRLGGSCVVRHEPRIVVVTFGTESRVTTRLVLASPSPCGPAAGVPRASTRVVDTRAYRLRL